MKIEEGKYYKTRDGRKVGPMVRSNGITYVWRDSEPYYYTEIGALFAFKTSDRDIIEEWRDTIDVYTIPTMPFGLLTPEQQKALRDLPSGEVEWYSHDDWVVRQNPAFGKTDTYRAKPKPALVPDTVPWDAIAPEWVKYKRFNNGECWLRKHDGGLRMIHGLLSGHSIGNMPAADATQYRPGYKP
jgi:hypothetical protein